MYTETILASGMRVWVSKADSDEPQPLLLMLHERYGPVQHSFNVIERAAEYGFVACFPDLFHRYEGDRGPLERSEARYDPTDEQVLADLDETIAYLRTQTFVNGNQIGIVGFCLSGRMPLVYAAARQDAQAIGIFHGGIYPRDYVPEFPGQDSTTNMLPLIDVPVLAGFGEDDRLVPLENIRRFRNELQQLEKRARVQVFADTPHGWMNTTRDEYRHEASERAWELINSFFREAFAGQWAEPRVDFAVDDGVAFDFGT
jgi:carboxymethylenebutenolidase